LDWYHTERDKVDRLWDEIREIQKELEQRRVEAESLRKRKSDDKKVESPIKEFSLRIPVRIGYWTYGKRDWVQLVQGTVEVNAGLEIYPKLQFPALLGMRNEFSWDLLAGYRHGTTGQEDVVDVHQVILNSMLAYHLNIYTANWLTVGLGVFYEYGKWHLEEAAYLQSVDYDQSLTGTSVSIDYAYRFNRYITFNMGTEFYFYFAAETSPVIRPRVGMVVTVTGGRYEE
jgi:hypothetical protein